MEQIHVDVPRDRPPDDTREIKLATDAQVKYIRGLVSERVCGASDEQNIARLNDLLKKGMSRSQASDTIQWLLRQPKRTQERKVSSSGMEAHSPGADCLTSQSADLPAVPEGRYATENKDGVLRFYRVSRPTDGKWKGWVFVDVMASDERHQIRGMAAKRTILENIAKDGIQAAAERYGQEIGCCSICGRTLTDATSRAIGIGPICRERTGWYG